jgi:uncharacterized membrane-anchored protein YitT (DUF2179 family)
VAIELDLAYKLLTDRCDFSLWLVLVWRFRLVNIPFVFFFYFNIDIFSLIYIFLDCICFMCSFSRDAVNDDAPVIEIYYEK